MTAAAAVAVALWIATAWIAVGPRSLAVSTWVGDRRLGVVATAAGVALTTLAPAGTMVLVGFVAGGRRDLWLAELIAAAGLALFGLVMAPAARASNAVAPLEWFRALFGRRVGLVFAVADVLFALGWIGAALLSVSGIAARLVDWPGPGVAIGAVAAAAVAVAGARGVARAAAVAAALLAVAAVVAYAAAFYGDPESAGLGRLATQFSAMPPAHMGWILGAVYVAREWSLGANWQRALAARDVATARWGFVLGGVLRMVLVSLMAGLGLLAASRLADRRLGLHDALLLLAETLPPTVCAMLVAAAVVALCAAVALTLHGALATLDRLRPRPEVSAARRGGWLAAGAMAAALVTAAHELWQAPWTAGSQVYHAAAALAALLAVLWRARTRRRGESPGP